MPSRIFCCVLAPKPFSSATWSGLAGGLELVEVVDAELVVEGLDLLGAESLDAQHLEQARRRLLAQVVEMGSWPVRCSSRMCSLQALADAAELAELAGLDGVGEVGFELLEGAGGVVVGVALEGVFALQFEEGADLVEGGGDLFFFHDCHLTGHSRHDEETKQESSRSGFASQAGMLVMPLIAATANC